MVRVATPRASSTGYQGNSAKPGAAAATSMVTEGTRESKKAQKSAHRQNQRPNQPSHSTPSRGDVRGADWAARGYAHGTTVARASRAISGEKAPLMHIVPPGRKLRGLSGGTFRHPVASAATEKVSRAGAC
jgi:hypothetical protein